MLSPVREQKQNIERLASQNRACADLCWGAILGIVGAPIWRQYSRPTKGCSAGTDWTKAAIEIAKDPACSHTDILDVMLGPASSGHVHLERSGCTSGPPEKTTGS